MGTRQKTQRVGNALGTRQSVSVELTLLPSSASTSPSVRLARTPSHSMQAAACSPSATFDYTSSSVRTLALPLRGPLPIPLRYVIPDVDGYGFYLSLCGSLAARTVSFYAGHRLFPFGYA